MACGQSRRCRGPAAAHVPHGADGAGQLRPVAAGAAVVVRHPRQPCEEAARAAAAARRRRRARTGPRSGSGGGGRGGGVRGDGGAAAHRTRIALCGSARPAPRGGPRLQADRRASRPSCRHRAHAAGARAVAVAAGAARRLRRRPAADGECAGGGVGDGASVRDGGSGGGDRCGGDRRRWGRRRDDLRRHGDGEQAPVARTEPLAARRRRVLVAAAPCRRGDTHGACARCRVVRAGRARAGAAHAADDGRQRSDRRQRTRSRRAIAEPGFATVVVRIRWADDLRQRRTWACWRSRSRAACSPSGTD